MTSALPLVLLLFIGSGAAALIYEIVWFQMLELVIGSSAVSVAVLLTTFMGGMCLGSLLLPRLVSARHHPLRVYAALEIAIGVCGVLMLILMPLVGRVYTTWGGYGFVGFSLRGVVAGICLLPPTLAMGATLPAVARWVESTPRGVAWLGFFYAGNIIGAVAGSLLAGFYLLRVYDTATASMVAASLNGAVAALAVVLAMRTAYRQAAAAAGDDATARSSVASDAWVIHVAIALSGACALAAQVIWTRQLALLLGATVYTFSIVLAVFLVGLGAGSSIGSLIARTLERPHIAFGWCQVVSVGAIAWSAYMLNSSLPFWPVNVELGTDIWTIFQMDLARTFWVVLPAPMLWGASFPLAIAAVAQKGRDAGRVVGGLYAANTLGAIVGALGASLLLMTWLGSQRAQQLLIVLAAIAGLLVLMPPQISRAKTDRAGWIGQVVLLLLITGATALMMRIVTPVPGLLVAYGRRTATMLSNAPDVLFVGEGLNASVAVTQFPGGATNYHNGGKIQASSLPQDMRLQRMLGHLTTLTPAQARSVLVIGCGAGVTAGAVSVDPTVERLTIAEIEPLVPQVVSTYFGPYNHEVIRNPKVQVVVDDARHFLLTTDQTFDAITSDPLDPWVKGAAALYTKEFWELARRRLNPGGVVTVFVQLYESGTEAVKSEVATFFEVFPDGVIFGNEYMGEGYDMVLVGQVNPAPIDVDAIERRLSAPEFDTVRLSLQEIGFQSAANLYGSYAGRAADLEEWLSDAAINADGNLRLQYLAGLGFNQRSANLTYSGMVQYRRFPEGLFAGSAERIEYLRRIIPTGAGVAPAEP